MTSTDLHTVALVAHVASGATALLLAAVVLSARARQDWTSLPGRAYVGAVCLVAATALVLVTTGSALPPAVRAVLALVAVVTATAAVQGLRTAHRPRRATRDWRPAHLRLMWGSVTSLVSAVAVVSTPPVVWVPVIIAGTALTEHSYRRAVKSTERLDLRGHEHASSPSSRRGGRRPGRPPA